MVACVHVGMLASDLRACRAFEVGSSGRTITPDARGFAKTSVGDG